MEGMITNDRGEVFTPNHVNGIHGADDIEDMIHVVLTNDYAVDPYSVAIITARAAIKVAFHGDNENRMSESEHANLVAIEEAIRERDNA